MSSLKGRRTRRAGALTGRWMGGEMERWKDGLGAWEEKRENMGGKV